MKNAHLYGVVSSRTDYSRTRLDTLTVVPPPDPHPSEAFGLSASISVDVQQYFVDEGCSMASYRRIGLGNAQKLERVNLGTVNIDVENAAALGELKVGDEVCVSVQVLEKGE